MKYAVILLTLYFKDHERQEQISIKLKEELKNRDEKKQVEEFINGYRAVIKYLNMDDFLYLLVDGVSIENVRKRTIRKEMLDITKLDI